MCPRGFVALGNSHKNVSKHFFDLRIIHPAPCEERSPVPSSELRGTISQRPSRDHWAPTPAGSESAGVWGQLFWRTTLPRSLCALLGGTLKSARKATGRDFRCLPRGGHFVRSRWAARTRTSGSLVRPGVTEAGGHGRRLCSPQGGSAVAAPAKAPLPATAARGSRPGTPHGPVWSSRL